MVQKNKLFYLIMGNRGANTCKPVYYVDGVVIFAGPEENSYRTFCIQRQFSVREPGHFILHGFLEVSQGGDLGSLVRPSYNGNDDK
jgi:Golgi nucleoside diphosphatase